MPLTDQTPVNSYSGNGVTTVFAYTFKIFADADLEVIVDGTTLTLTTDYSVIGAGDAGGGNVTFVTAPASGTANVVLQRAMDYDRTTDYQDNGDLLADTLDNDIDRIVALVQQLRSQLIRSIKLPAGTTTEQVVSDDAATRASKLFGFDGDGNVTTYAPADLSLTTITSFAETLLDDATAAAMLTTLGAPTKADIQNQAYNAGTTGGTSTAYTLTPTPAITSLAENQDFDVEFHTGAGTTPTLSISGQAAKALKYRDDTGALQDVTLTQVPTGWRSRVTYDGTYYIVREVPTTTGGAMGVRQTVFNGTVDSSGYSAFGGSTGSTTVTASGTLTATAANGFGSSGAVDRIGSITNPSWTGLSTNGTMFLYLDIAADGSCTTGSTPLAPVYQWGGTYSATSGQFTFNIQEMVGKVGNGATATQTYRVFVGEVTVAVGVVSAITWYALMGRASVKNFTLAAAGSGYSWSHNIGVQLVDYSHWLECVTTEHGYAVGDYAHSPMTYNASGTAEYSTDPIRTTGRNSLAYYTGAQNLLITTTSGAVNPVTLVNWAGNILATRGW